MNPNLKSILYQIVIIIALLLILILFIISSITVSYYCISEICPLR